MIKYALTVFTIIMAGLFIVENVSAVSDYDDAYQTTEMLTLSSDYYGCGSENISSNWSELFLDEDNWSASGYSTFASEYSEALDNGSWAVSQETSSGEVTINLVYTTVTGNIDLGYSTEHVYAFPQSGETLKRVQLANKSGCGYDVYNVDGGIDAGRIISSSSINNTLNFISANWNVSYPSGYEGDDIIESHFVAPVYEASPDIRVLNVVDYKAIIQDTHFNTFDEVPFLCNDDLTPMVNFNLYNKDESTFVSTHMFSPTVQYELDIPVEDSLIEYRITSVYTCGAGEQPIFSGEGITDFKVTGNGALKNEIWEVCFNMEAPFIHLDSCTSNVERAVNMLSFEKIAFSNEWEHEEKCSNLEVLDEWLNVDNAEVCPMFPEYVRNTVTPFVTFGLGLVTLGFLNNRNSGMYG